MGPVAEAVERGGGSVARVFKRAELPMRLLEQPDRIFLLKDQLNLVECAAREIGDEALPARLSVEAGMAGLGSFGHRMRSASRLGVALARSNALIVSLLQSSTRLTLTTSGGWAKWTYEVTDPVVVGRQKNEILALGYMLDVMRGFVGTDWTPSRVELGGWPLVAKPTIETVFRCDLTRGETAALMFPADLLHLPNPRPPRQEQSQNVRDMPDPDNLVECLEQLISLALLEGRPRLEWLCDRLGRAPRSLQRALNARGTTFERVMQRVLVDECLELLARQNASITTIALELGYADPAHFTRAFRRWTGETPRAWRRRHQAHLE
jgi:AraC-like DNA-binding protein